MVKKGEKRDRDSQSDLEKSIVSESSQERRPRQSNRNRERSASKARRTDSSAARDSQPKISNYTVADIDDGSNTDRQTARDSSEGSGDIAEVIRRIVGLETCIQTGNSQMMEKIEVLTGQLFDLQHDNKKLRSQAVKLQEAQKEMTEEITRLKKKTNDEREKNNDIEQQGRKDNIRCFGIEGDSPKENSKDCERKVIHIIKQKLGLSHINEKDISIAHRTGRPMKEKNRPVVVKFISRKIRNEVLYNRRKLKGTGVSFQEDLTKLNAVRLQRLSHHDQVKQAWSKNGKLYVNLRHHDRVLQITRGDGELDVLLSAIKQGNESRVIGNRQHNPRNSGTRRVPSGAGAITASTRDGLAHVSSSDPLLESHSASLDPTPEWRPRAPSDWQSTEVEAEHNSLEMSISLSPTASPGEIAWQ